MDSNFQAEFPNANPKVLNRFLSAHKNNTEQAAQAYREHLAWRKENQIDQIDQFEFREGPSLQDIYPHGFAAGRDKNDRLIYVDKLGEAQVQAIFALTNQERLLKHLIQLFEQIDREIIVIVDLKGGITKLIPKATLQFIQNIIQMLLKQYPEVLHKLFIINAPMNFDTQWTHIKSQLNSQTKQKITIVGEQYKDLLTQYIDPANIPSIIGGSDKRPLVQDLKQTTSIQMQEEVGEKSDDEDQEQDANALDQLKFALSNMVSQPQQKVPHNPNKYQVTTQSYAPVSDTPLNTEQNEIN